MDYPTIAIVIVLLGLFAGTVWLICHCWSENLRREDQEFWNDKLQ
jgi:hypothetical protein